MKYDFKDITFLIPVKLDSIDRLENLLASVTFLQKHFECKIKIFEIGKFNNEVIERLLFNIDYTFIEDFDPVFFRTKYLNQMTETTCTPYLAIWDSDIIISPKQMLNALTNLRSGKAHIAFPYDGVAIDTSFLLRNQYLVKQEWEFLWRNQGKMKAMNTMKSYGGAFFVNRSFYIKAGMENENFYGWGPEDIERYQRWKNLDFKIFWEKGCLFHLTHLRGNNSRSLQGQIESSRNEMRKSIYSSKNDIYSKVEHGYYLSN